MSDNVQILYSLLGVAQSCELVEMSCEQGERSNLGDNVSEVAWESVSG